MVNPAVFSFEKIKHKRARLDQQIRQAEEQIAEDFQTVFARQETSDNKLQNYVNVAARTWFFVDGALTGYKLLRKIGGISRLFRGNKNKR
ncbi:hypothetical protein EII14_06655 [Alloprevotella sp. OH1205_COT-284]|uniref:hypothetical protein n=1 Tax=Alloprevotella sp. OH1205_COT-284 TaxID=2491043 RepID=UPI000F5F8451|nr:hypothetical protein [Alloprevotella sp. OH1205_COT-284]RRD78503.1 hypothetical protein EII14_06655 [Alloprevotella sp. OH1205_COT-284]